MKILFFYHDSLATISGTPLRIVGLAREFVRQGHDVVLVSPGRALPEFVHYVLPSGLRRYFSPFSLYKVIYHVQPDVVYSFTSLSLFSSLLASSFARKKLCVEIHGLWYEEFQFKHPSLRFLRFFFKPFVLLDRYLVHRVDKVFTVCDSLTRYYTSRTCHPLTIFLGVDVSLFHPRVKKNLSLLSFKKKRILVTYAGNFNVYQGIDFLFNVIRALPSDHPFCFAFLGNPSDYVVPPDLSPSFVSFYGRVPQTSIPHYLAASDILVIPRLESAVAIYSFPSKLLEYLAMGKVVIVTRVGSLEKVIHSGKNGLVVEPTVSSLVDGLMSLQNSQLRKFLAENAQKMVRTYSLETHVIQLLSHLSSLVRR